MLFFSKKRKLTKEPVNLHVTLWTAFDHFNRFANDNHRINGIRLNSAMISSSEIDDQFVRRSKQAKVPLWFDIKGMQMRIKEVICDESHDHLEFILNRPIRCSTPTPVWFKGGNDCAKLVQIKNGVHLIFEGGPRYNVRAGESIHIRESDFEISGPLLLDFEKEKISKIQKHGMTNWYLSYVYKQKHVDEFREVIGKDANLILKIENLDGLKYISSYKPLKNTNLAAARGDLFVEVDRPHDILKATKLVLEKDPQAIVGSRMLLSVIQNQEPSCADLCELAWLYDIGYRNFLLCDELCLKEDLLGKAINVFSAFKKDYCDA
jgi:pyruvate kinase